MTRRQPLINYLTNNNDTRYYSNSIIKIMNYLVTGLICSGKSTFLEIARNIILRLSNQMILYQNYIMTKTIVQ